MNELTPEIYDALKKLARGQRLRVWAKQPLSTRSIIHEAYLKLVEARPEVESESFLLMASSAMRSVLVDNARHWQRQKRGGDTTDVPLDQVQLVSLHRTDELIELDKALNELEADHPRLAQVFECRTFGGLSIEETAKAAGLSPATVKRDWLAARTLLYQKMSLDPAEEP